MGVDAGRPTAGRVRADALRLLGCARVVAVHQMAQVITEEGVDGRSYVRRAMKRLAEQGVAETNGKSGRHPIWKWPRKPNRQRGRAARCPHPAAARRAGRLQ